MAIYTFHIFALCIILLGSALPARCSVQLSIDPHAVTVIVGQQPSSSSEDGKFTLAIASDSPLRENVTVKLSASFDQIIQVAPDEVIFKAGSQKDSQEIQVLGFNPGYVDIIANVSSSLSINTNAAFLKVTSERSSNLALISITVGWIYFVVWSVSFYPQLYENWKRKSVVGLNFDFLLLNLTGFTLYSLFNCGLYWIPAIQDQFYERYPHSGIPVQPNDIFFAVHAVAITLVTILQCFMYERGGQTVSIIARCIQGIFFVFLLISLLCCVFGVLLWLDFLYYCSYVKLTITLIKYVPQGYMNFRRKSTLGWSIGNILCDFTGGVLSVLQMLLDAYNYNDWTSIFGSPTKFGLGLFSILFDIFFMVQHYILYRHQDNLRNGYERLDGHNAPEESSSSTAIETTEEDMAPQGLLKEGATSDSVT